MQCKCCGKDARWCGEDGQIGKSCGISECDHIHCDHCGMHYSLESKEAIGAETKEEMRSLMMAAYNVKVSGWPTLLFSIRAARIAKKKRPDCA